MCWFRGRAMNDGRRRDIKAGCGSRPSLQAGQGEGSDLLGKHC